MYLQALSNTVWAFSKLNVTPSPALLEAIATMALRKLPDFNAQNIANTVCLNLQTQVNRKLPNKARLLKRSIGYCIVYDCFSWVQGLTPGSSKTLPCNGFWFLIFLHWFISGLGVCQPWRGTWRADDCSCWHCCDANEGLQRAEHVRSLTLLFWARRSCASSDWQIEYVWTHGWNIWSFSGLIGSSCGLVCKKYPVVTYIGRPATGGSWSLWFLSWRLELRLLSDRNDRIWHSFYRLARWFTSQSQRSSIRWHSCVSEWCCILQCLHGIITWGTSNTLKRQRLLWNSTWHRKLLSSHPEHSSQTVLDKIFPKILHTKNFAKGLGSPDLAGIFWRSCRQM